MGVFEFRLLGERWGVMGRGFGPPAMTGGAFPMTWSRLRFMSFRSDSKLEGDILASCLGVQARVRKSRPIDAHLEREGGRGGETEGCDKAMYV